jgi:SAM-dependent methyltransferase
MAPTHEEIRAGQAIYTPLSLRAYDVIVHGISNHWIWRCPTHQLQRLYDRNVTASHVDIGVGTGYFLAHAHWPVAAPQITLVDLNPHCLARAASRIAKFQPRTVTANVLAPWPDDTGELFTSAGLCYLLHCLPGTIPEKAVVFDHLMAHLVSGGHVFGATILGRDVKMKAAARRLMAIYNAKGVFSNSGDTLRDLESALTSRFDVIDIRREGVVALFEARTR